jgi:hypothetical protein
MNNASNDLAEAEARAKRSGLKVADLCRAAGVHRATWQRWKAEKTSGPTINQWRAVQELLARQEAA